MLSLLKSNPVHGLKCLIHSGRFKYSPRNRRFFIGIQSPWVSVINAYALYSFVRSAKSSKKRAAIFSFSMKNSPVSTNIFSNHRHFLYSSKYFPPADTKRLIIYSCPMSVPAQKIFSYFSSITQDVTGVETSRPQYYELYFVICNSSAFGLTVTESAHSKSPAARGRFLPGQVYMFLRTLQ